MARQRDWILLLAVISVAAKITRADSIGKEFLFSFPDYGYADQLSMVVTTQEKGEITIEIPYLNSITRKALNTGSNVFNVSSVLASDKLAVRRKGIRVTSTVNITLHALQMQYVSDYSFLVLPMDSLSNRYIATTFNPESDSSGESQSYITITTYHENTNVNLTLPLPVNNSKSATFSPKTDIATRDRDLVTAELNMYESLNFAFDGDLTGTLIESNYPIHITSGSSNVKIPKVDDPNFDFREQNIISSVLPTDLLGKRFIIMPFMNQAGYVVRVTASKVNTSIDITSHRKVTLAKAGDFHDVIVNARIPLYVLSDLPVSVVQFTKSTNFRTRSDKDGGNVMIPVPSIEQYGNTSYHFTVPIWSLDTRDKIYNYIAISIPTAHIGCLLLDGKYPYMHADIQTLTVEGTNYNIISTEIENPGYHNLVCNDSSIAFGVIIYGFSASNGYGYPVYINY